MSNILNISDTVSINLEEISEANHDGGKFVKLKHEFIYADYDLTTAEQNLVYYFMSKFDSDDFLRAPEVYAELYDAAASVWDFSKINRRLIDKVFWSVEHRSVVLSAYDVASAVQNGNTKNYRTIERAVEALQSKLLKIRGESSDGSISKRTISPIECSAFFKDKDGVNKVLISFSQSFMPYVLAFSGYQRIDFKVISDLKLKYSPRYYHWFLHQLSNPNASNTINISVDSIRERFGIEDGALVKHFFKRVVEAPLDELNAKTDINVKVGKVYDNTKRGKPLSKLVFKVSRKKGF